MGEEATLTTFKDMIKEQLEIEQKNELYNKELKTALIESLLKSITFDLPELIVEQEMDILFRNSLSQLKPKEFENLKNNKDEARKQREEKRDEARKSVQITFIMDALAKQYNIVVSDNEVMQTIYYEAMMMGQDPRATIEYYQKNNILPAIKMTMIEDRVLHHLLDTKFESTKSTSKNAKVSKADGGSK